MEGERSIRDKECTIRPLNSLAQIFCPQCTWRENLSQGIRMPFCCISNGDIENSCKQPRNTF